MIPEISMPYHKQYLGIPREKGVSWNGILKLGWGGGVGLGVQKPETKTKLHLKIADMTFEGDV